MAKPIPPLTAGDLARFWAKVRKTNGCWLWTGDLGVTGGYGRIGLGGRAGSEYRAHRVSWVIAYGEQPPAHVLHSCDNPACVRPDHLFSGTDADNVADMHRKGRGNIGERNGQARLTKKQVQTIRRKYASGGYTMRDLAQIFTTSVPNIHHIIHHETWRSA